MRFTLTLDIEVEPDVATQRLNPLVDGGSRRTAAEVRTALVDAVASAVGETSLNVHYMDGQRTTFYRVSKVTVRDE